MTAQNRIQIYQSPDGKTRVDVRFESDTVWLTQRQMADVFGTTPENVLMHLKNIYKDGELSEKGTAKDFLVVRMEGKRQSVFGEPAYPTIESKAAHLLYFVVKNHPFSDGNKRGGASLFVDFLHRNNRLFNETGEPVINDAGLAALTLLVAESDPRQKEVIIKLIMNLLCAPDPENSR
jgi:prophage maintenance system killer protein